MNHTIAQAARQAEAAHRVPAPVLLAVALVETDATPFAAIAGRQEPLIRFEGHYFDARLSGDALQIARAAGLAHPRAGRVRNPAGQRERWAMLERAMAISRAAAIESTSWGVGQVMGAHWRSLGFDSAEALAAEVRASLAGQFALMARFLRANRLDGLLPAGDWRGFARRYNGPAFAANRYDIKIAQAFRKAEAALAGASAILSEGARGEAVAALQRALSRHGHRLAADGIFGARTRAALAAFQTGHGLAPTGALDGRSEVLLGLATANSCEGNWQAGATGLSREA